MRTGGASRPTSLQDAEIRWFGSSPVMARHGARALADPIDAPAVVRADASRTCSSACSDWRGTLTDMRVAIIDYGSGNLRSATKAFERAAREAGVNADIDLTADADRVASPTASCCRASAPMPIAAPASTPCRA